MRDLVFTPCRAVADSCTRVDVYTLGLVATSNNGIPAGECYYEYVLIHVDELMVDSRREEQVMQEISNTYRLKKDDKTGLLYGPPNIYLVEKILRHQET